MPRSPRTTPTSAVLAATGATPAVDAPAADAGGGAGRPNPGLVAHWATLLQLRTLPRRVGRLSSEPAHAEYSTSTDRRES